MIEVFFIADTHFGHKGILAYEPNTRGHFATIEDHDEELIKRWNAVVRPSDHVYHLGDFCLNQRKVAEIAPRLNGVKRLILGNHDLFPTAVYMPHFVKIHGVYPKYECIMTHVPLHTAHTRWELNVHGHLHSKRVKMKEFPDHPHRQSEIDDPQYFCVSAEQNNLTPINLSVIQERIKQLRS